MSYFNQEKFSNSESFNSSSQLKESNSDEVVEKGHKNTLKIDIEKFDDICKKFREKKDLKIKKLSGSDKEDFELVISYVHMLYGTSYYSNLYDRVRKYFENVTTVKNGTVGAYFAGCIVAINNENNGNNGNKENKEGNKNNNPGCAISCAGSMPLPKDEEGWSFCDKGVILAEKGNDGYVFSVVKPGSEEEMNPAYLFVESKSLHDFKGFSQEEKDQILAYGCKNVKLVGYSNDLTYSDLYKDPKPVREIKHRHVYKNKKEGNRREEGSSSALIFAVILFILVLFFILCLLGYKYYNM